MKRLLFLFSAVGLLLAGCQTTEVKPDPSILRVGVSPNAQPLVFRQNKQIVGIEADFAKKLAKALNRKLVFIDVPWEKQLDYLEQNKTDIIMSGMSITSARSIRIDFSNPYMQAGLTALFRRDNYDPAGLPASTIRNQKRVGFVKGTTSELFVFQQFPLAEKKGYSDSTLAVQALKAKRIDMFIYDAPVIWWQYALNESDVMAFPSLLNVEPLAWGVSKANNDLLQQVNKLLAQWEEDGTTKKIIQHWIPFFGK
jgi:polar amino acid transport system substrate-binding protein